MNKRLLCFLISLMLLISAFPVAQAAELVDKEIIILEDGGSLVITIEKIPSRSIYSQSGKKTIVKKEQDGTLNWKAELTGTFIYTGTSATCTQSTISVTVYADNWYEVSKTAGKSGASATGSVTMGRKVLGVTVAKETFDMTLTCSPTGTLS